MKKHIHILGRIALLAVLIFSFASCGKDDNGGGQNDPLNGTWVGYNTYDSSQNPTWTFNNGSFEFVQYAGTVGMEGSKGLYTTDGNSIIIQYTHYRNSDGVWKVDNIKEGMLFTYTYSVNGNTLSMTDRYGTIVYTRRR